MLGADTEVILLLVRTINYTVHAAVLLPLGIFLRFNYQV